MKLATLDLTNSRYLDHAFQSVVKLTKNSEHVFDSFHNSYFESYWFQYTSLREVLFQLKIMGKGKVELIRTGPLGTEVAATQVFDFTTLKNLKISFDLFPNESSRVYLKITPTTDVEIENSVTIHGTQDPQRDVHLAIIICTFHKEPYIKKNLQALLTSDDFLSSNSKIFVVDNASSLNLETNERLRYIAQNNFGGAGGFTRGLIEARAEERFTHYLFMDDDIELDPDMITRTRALLSYRSREFSICGAMLALNAKNKVSELGSIFFNNKMSAASEPLYQDRNLDKGLLDEISKPFPFDYGGWWFFCFSNESVEQNGLPFPFFIRGDDVEYGLRLKENRTPNFTLPGIGVWHETFAAKTAPWLLYFRFRNYFIISVLYGSLISSYRQALKFLMTIFGYLLVYDYNMAEIQLNALEGVLIGSSDIGPYSSPDFKKEITLKLRELDQQDIKGNFSQDIYQRASKINLFKKAVTLNGHLLSGTSREIKIDFPDWRRRALKSGMGRGNYVVSKAETGTFQVYTKSTKRFATLLLRLAKVSAIILVALPVLSSRYKGQHKEYFKPLKWKRLLGVR